MADDDNKLCALLNDLNEKERDALYNLMLDKRGTYRVKQFDDELLPTYTALNSSLKSGKRWAAWATCNRLTGDGGSGHVRWQVNFGGKGVDVKTPQKPPRKGEKPVGEELKGFLREEQWNKFKAAARGPASRPNLKFQAHHIAYAAGEFFKQQPLPLDPGRGGSVSHLCDQDGCVTMGHLLVATKHMANMDRQRCNGVSLTVCQGVIMGETPCKHALELEDGTVDIATSCAKVLVLETPDTLEPAADVQDDFVKARTEHEVLLERRHKRRRVSDISSPIMI